MLFKNLLITVILVIIANCTLAEPYFHEYIIDDNTRGTQGIYGCDIDNDGDNDILGAAGEDHQMVWWRNEGGNPISWTKFVIANNFYGAGSVHAAHIDSDSLIDVLGVAKGGNEVAWWRNEGGDPIAWTKHTIKTNYDWPHEIYAHDLDNDEDNDILVACSGLGLITWWRNDGGNPVQWTEQTIQSGFTQAKSVHVGDFDGDDDWDVVAASLTTNDVKWWRNDGIIDEGIEWTPFTVDYNFQSAHRVQAVDLDEDGDDDILGAGWAGNTIAWWRNDGGDPIEWTRFNITTNFVRVCIAYAVDLDGDEHLDIVAGAQDGDELAWWHNDEISNGEISWTKFTIDDDFHRVWPVYACDFDGDDDNDIVAASGHTADALNFVKLYSNMGEFYVIPNFSADYLTGNRPLNINFTEESIGNPEITSWEWDFNNDDIIDSQEQNPTWTYEESGTYTVKLTVTNDATSEIIIRQDYITVFDGQSALLFDGQNSYVKIPAAPELNIAESFTIEAWIKPYGWGENTTSGYGRIVDKNKLSVFLINTNPAFNDQSLALFTSHSDGTVSRSFSPVNSINLDDWQHVAVAYDALTSALNMYINGDLVPVTSMVVPSGNLADNLDIDMFIGNNASEAFTFDGLIDEVRIWNFARSQQAIETDMNYHLSGSETGLIGYWKMNEGNGEAIMDEANDNHGEIFETTWEWGKILNNSSIKDSYFHHSLPEKIHLDQNYPNPFNPITIINYYLPKAENVILSIHNSSGQLVKKLVDKNQKSGYHSVKWNAKDVSSGVYFYKIETSSGFSQVKRCVVLK